MKNVIARLITCCILTWSLQAVEFEIVPFNEKDQDMKEQLCSMVGNDTQMQRNTFLSDDKEELESFFKDNKNSRTYLLVAQIKNQQPPVYAGFIKYSIEKRCRGHVDGTYTYGDLEILAVDGLYRKKGVASLLIKNFEDNCQHDFSFKKWDEKEIEPILDITVFSNNKEALALYKKLGYELYQSSAGYIHARKSLLQKQS